MVPLHCHLHRDWLKQVVVDMKHSKKKKIQLLCMTLYLGQIQDTLTKAAVDGRLRIVLLVTH